MGKASRDKGKRGEYAVRDALRAAGFQAERVPLSGAFAKYEIGEGKNYAGDVRATRDGREWLFEVKVRKNSFKSIYDLGFGDFHVADRVVSIWGLPNQVMFFENRETKPFPGTSITVRRLFGFRSLLKGADVLVIKDDRKPLLWIRYW